MKRLFGILFLMTLLVSNYAVAHADSGYMSSFNSRYGTAGTAIGVCLVCHTTASGPALNSYGNAFKNNSHNYATIEPMDSDGDGFTNIVEINARTFPGNASSKPSGTDTAAPSVTGFSIPSTSNSLTVPITTFTATDNVGVSGYMLTEASTKPSASASGWSAAAPTSYTFTSAGAKTLYAWAKDAAGNVSASRSASVTITLPDTTLPTVTSFSIPSTSSSLTVPITSFTATDNVGVNSYLVTETSATPSATAGWTASAPTSYTFASTGAKTLYAWAKDAAGNVSASRSANVSITLPDTAAPTVTAFNIPSTSLTLAVPILTFTATDNVGVTGYLLNESSVKPAASATGWSAASPTSYTFTSAGAKTLYAWAKDAAGNVSASLSGSVTITLPDTTPPTVTNFSIPSTSTSLTVPITSFTATDNVGVTSYLLTETSATPSATAGWTASAPTSYTFASSGAKILYAWAKDATGNVSTSISAGVAISVSVDTTVPKITAFNMPATSTSLTVPINKFTATDNVKVTGYLIKTSSTKPLATSTLWRAIAPKSRTFGSAGTKTLYAWVKDAAGNISGRRSRTVTITLPLTTAYTSSTPADAAVKQLIPVPSGLQIFTYEPTDVPITNTNPAYAKPVSVGPIAIGGDTLSIHVSIGKFVNPVDISLTAYTPSGTGYQPVDISTLKPDNNFELLSGQMKTWKTGVTGVDESVVDNIPISDLPSGLHVLILTVTSPDSPDSYYQWFTYFTVP